ncbi:MAG: TraB/GumN family protein [Candidatus Thorarchaeota archaeon]|nr:MAG: TraB/GumN family protein [Candidatus Thorarchaeota archaeon]
METTELDRIVFVPVIHADADSVKRARSVVIDIKPDVVAVELDRQRYEQLQDSEAMSKMADPPTSTNMVEHLMFQIAQLERDLGQKTGAIAGEEMLAAIEEGRKIGAKIALVDRPIQVTMKAIMRVPLDEIYRLTNMIPSASQDIEEGGSIDLLQKLKEEGTVDELVDVFRTEFPGLYDALISQRDLYVANALRSILDDVDGKIVAVLGVGHIEGVSRELTNLLRERAGS